MPLYCVFVWVAGHSNACVRCVCACCVYVSSGGCRILGYIVPPPPTAARGMGERCKLARQGVGPRSFAVGVLARVLV